MTQQAGHPITLEGSTILVGGASSQIGRFLLPRLIDAGALPVGLTRNEPPAGWRRFDFASNEPYPADTGATGLIHLGPLWLLPDAIGRMADAGLTRLIAFGSTSMHVKAASSTSAEREVVARLRRSEEAIAKACGRHNIRWTIFRPTLIYGAGSDNNVAAIGRVIRRFGFFPLAGPGGGLRQPVHADDLASACVAAYNRDATFDKAYDLTGHETLSYREMVETVFATLGKTPHIVSLSIPLMRVGLRLLSVIPGYTHVTPDMADRMGRDLTFDSASATADFGWAPRRFRPLPATALTPEAKR